MAAKRQFELTADFVGVPAAEFEWQVDASCWISKFIIPNSKFKPASRRACVSIPHMGSCKVLCIT